MTSKSLRTGLLLLVTAACTGCNRGEGQQRIGVRSGETGVFFDPQTLVVSLEHGDDVLLRFGTDAIQLGRVGAIDDEVNYDPYPLLVPDAMPGYQEPAGLRWLGVTSAEPVENPGAQRLELELAFRDGSRALLRLESSGTGGETTGSFRAELVPRGDTPVAYFRLRPQVDTAEGFYGLGGVLDRVEQRGTIRAMQLEVDLELESGYNEAHVPVPFVIGTRGWGLFVETAYPAVFDLAAGADDRIEALVGTGAASADGLVFHLYAAAHPLDLTRCYYRTTAFPALPAPWALGPWVWRDENRDQAQVEADLEAMRDLDLPASAIWLDRPYATGVNTFDFDQARFPDPDAMIARAHELGFRMALWHTPYLDEDDPATAALLEHAASAGYHPPRTGLLLNHWGKPIDFTNPDAYAWWQEQIRRYTDRGVEGFKLDYAEDVVPGLFGARNKWEFFDGSDERTMHSRYQIFYHRVYAEMLPATGGFLLCRGGTWGDQAWASVIWPGDLDANLARHRAPCTDRDGESYVAVGGLPASVVYGLSLGVSGFPFFGSDTGGYRHSPPDKETFTRWFEQTALSSVMQIGTSSNDVAWEPTTENGFDQEMLGWYRRYTRLHLRLWAYAWSLARQLLDDGRPLQRPLGLAYPELGVHPDSVYLFGPHLLVAPVVERGARSKEVVFPPGRWVDWWTGEVLEGDCIRTVNAPLDMLPLYLRADGIVPMLRPTIDTLAPTVQPERVDSYATDAGILWPRVTRAAPGKASSFTLFDGTLLSREEEERSLSLAVEPGASFDQGVMFEVLSAGTTAPASVTDNGVTLDRAGDLERLQAAGSGWTLEAGTLWLLVGPGPRDLRIDW